MPTADKNQEKKPEVLTMPNVLERSVDQVDVALTSGQDLVLDFSDCRFISVDGLEWLEELMLRSKSVGNRVTFANLAPAQYKLFKVARIDSLLAACGAPSPGGNVC